MSREPGYYDGWATQFDYAKFQGEIWEVRNVRELLETLITRLWRTHQDEILDLPADQSPIESVDGPGYLRLDDHHYLRLNWYPQYILGSIQFILQYLNLEDDLSVKLSEQDE